MPNFLFFSILALFVTPEANASMNTCTSLAEVEGARLSHCNLGIGSEEFLLVMPGQSGSQLEIHAVFANDTGKNSFYRLWEKAGAQTLSRENQGALSRLLAKKGRAQLGERGFALVNFLANFAAPGFELRYYEFNARSGSPVAGYTSICEKFGQLNMGYFSVGRVQERREGIVGSPNCLGKCGAGCSGSRFPREGKYTQECFNHDLCSRATGQNMGVCEDEFWAAADGFMNAPDCH